MKINGKQVDGKAGMNLLAYIEQAGYQKERIVVERNGEIPPKTEYASIILEDTDTIEIVSFMGGGCR